MTPLLSSLVSLVALVAVLPVDAAPNTIRDNDVSKRHESGGTWYHKRDHPVHELFKRDGNASYPAVGSATWTAQYPASSADTNSLPAAWTNALNAAVAAGAIPNIPQTTVDATTGDSAYPQGTNGDDASICAWTNRVCFNSDDMWNAPDGVWGLGFDDGPLPPSQDLYQFLQQQKLRATHYYIGLNILANPSMFTMAYETLGDDIAVHTWTHPYLSSLSNAQIVGELGWTMQIIHDSTGGRIPRFYRPPYGDIDNRVRAIAKQVFGLSAIIWNQDSEDWTLTEAGGTTPQAIQTNFQAWFGGSKSPGLIILEHELSNQSVQAFIDGFPLAQTAGWQTQSQALIAAVNASSKSPWQNAPPGNTGTPVNADIGPSAGVGYPPASTTTTTTSSSSSSSSSSTSTQRGTPIPKGGSVDKNNTSGAVSSAQFNAGVLVLFTGLIASLSIL